MSRFGSNSLLPWVGLAVLVLVLTACDKPCLTHGQLEADWGRQSATRLKLAPAAPGQGAEDYPIERVVERGLKLAESQQRLGQNVDASVKLLRELARQASQIPAEASPPARQKLYFRAREVIRELALRNPLLDFDRILFVKHRPGHMPHVADQHYGWWSRGGGGIYLLEGFKTSHPRLRCLSSDLPDGSFMGPDISYDGQKVLFAYCKYYPNLRQEMCKTDKSRIPEDAFYHVFEMGLDGSHRRQLTHGKYDDFDPRWLPNGEVVFLSTRKGCTLQCSKASSEATLTVDGPDSYSRCGGGFHRPVPVFTLHAMDADGRNLRPLSAFESCEWTPSVAEDGRLLYTRWDYVDRFNGNFFSLWSANQDGTNPQLVYGNYTACPQVVSEARSIPGSSKLVCTASAHHSIGGGPICLLDRARGTEEQAPLTRLTPEVPFPECNGVWPQHYYTTPFPLSEEYFLVAWSDLRLPWEGRIDDGANPPNALGLYLLDAFGNLEILYRDATISSMSPLPVAPRPKPPTLPSQIAWEGAQEGRFLILDISHGLEGLAAGAIKQLRVVAVPPKVQPHMNRPSLGVSSEDPGKYVLGTVPVEPDGSAYFRVPSGVPVFFQALDAQGLAVQTMRSLTYTLPGQTLACIGCHEPRDEAPPTSRPALATLREPSKLALGPEGSWPLRFDRLVQPLLDRHCVCCHSPSSTNRAAAKLDFTGTNAYTALISFGQGDLKKAAFERDRSRVGQGTAASSKLWSLLASPEGHQGVKLDSASLHSLATWLDTYAQHAGSFSAQQEQELLQLRMRLGDMLFSHEIW